MRLLIEHLDEHGTVLGSKVIEHREGRPLTVGPEPGADLPTPDLGATLTIRRVSSGRTMLEFLGHQRELTFVEPVAFAADGVFLRLCLLAGDVGGLGLCPRCGGALRHLLGGGAYRSVARDIRSCPACHAQILELEEAVLSVGSFVDTTSTDFFMVLTPRRCPECDGSLKRSQLRTANGQTEVERCVPCRLLVIERPDLDLLTGR